MSWVEDRLAVFASPDRARSLFTVRAANSAPKKATFTLAAAPAGPGADRTAL